MFDFEQAYAVFDAAGQLECVRVGMRPWVQEGAPGEPRRTGVAGLSTAPGGDVAGPPGEIYLGRIEREDPDGVVYFRDERPRSPARLTFVPLTIELWQARVAPVVGPPPAGITTTAALHAFFVGTYLGDSWRAEYERARAHAQGFDRDTPG